MAASSTGVFATANYRYDAISAQEGINYLLKKSIGLPNTTPQGPLLTESAVNSLPFLYNTKLYAQTIPIPNPNDFTIRDTKFSNFGYRFLSRPCINDTLSARYISSNYPYIGFYSNLLLSYGGFDQTNNNYSNIDISFGHPLLINSISKYFDSTYSYSWNMSTSNMLSNILNDDGWWLCDTDSGVITFYDSNTTVSQLSRTNPPRFTFYRYEGLIGANVNIASTQDL